VLYRVAKDLLVALAPMTSFTAEEAWAYLPGEKPASIFLADFPQGGAAADATLDARYDKLFALRAAVLPLLEGARRDKLIGKSLEARVVLTATGAAKAFLEQHQAELAELFIVSQVDFAAASDKAQPISAAPHFEPGSVQAEVLAATGARCPRCLKYRREVGAQELCHDCTDAVQ
jgi:isoleucyl-tRNA synthetase